MFGRLLQSLRVQLILMVLVVALPVFGLILFSGVERRQEAIDAAFTETARLAEAIAYEKSHMITGAQQLARTLAQLSEIRTFDEQKVRPVFADILEANPQFLNIFIADATGTVRITGLKTKAQVNVADRRYFVNAVRTGRFSSGEYIVGRLNVGQPTMAFGYPVIVDGAVAGIIGISFNLDSCRELLNQACVPNGTNYGLIDHRGIVVNRYLNPDQFIGKPDSPEIFRRMVDGPDENSFQGLGNDGFHRIFSVRKLRLPGEHAPYLYVRVGMPIDEVLNTANALLLKNLGLL